MERVELIARLREFAGEALVERHGAWFLVDPGWRARERAQWEALVAQRPIDWQPGESARRGWLCIPTGGSSGAMKLARHDERTLSAAVAGFCAHFQVRRVDALGLLPPWHVSGLMAWARCVWTGGTYRSAGWKDVVAGAVRPPGVGAFLSLVPTQLARLVGDPEAEAWLRDFGAIFVGGGPSWPDLLARARAARVPVALSYGMTETAAMIAAQGPEEFADGDDSCGLVMPHAKIERDAEGRVNVASESLFLGYWPQTETPPAAFWRTDDLGGCGPDGRLRIEGRADALIITGGEKVNPAEVEAAIREAAGPALHDVAVVGVPHPEWGSEVVAFYTQLSDVDRLDVDLLKSNVSLLLSSLKQPKRYLYLAIRDWPRDARGKVCRSLLIG